MSDKLKIDISEIIRKQRLRLLSDIRHQGFHFRFIIHIACIKEVISWGKVEKVS